MPTASYFGRNSFVGIGPESTYGTAAAEAAVTRPIISCTMLRQIDKVPRPNLRVQGVAGLRASHYLAADRSSGSLELECTYDNCGYYLKAALGAGETSTASPVNTHTYTLGDVPIEGNTLFLQRGTSDNYERFEGVVINSMSCSVAAGEHMTMSFDLIGETSSSSAGTARHDSPSLSFVDPTNENLVLHHHAGTLSYRSQTITLVDFEYSIENNLSERMRLGSLNTKQPTQSDFRNVTMTVSFETDDATYQKFISDESGDAVVTFNNGASSGSEREMKFSLNNAYIETYTDEISESGLILASVTLRAQGDGTSGLALGTSIEVKNEAASSVHAG